MKQITQITERVKVVKYDGQAPHPNRIHWLVVVDDKAVWHLANNPVATANLQPLAEYIARKEAVYLETGVQRVSHRRNP